MNNNKKIVNKQVHFIKNRRPSYWSSLIKKYKLNHIIDKHSKDSRNRLYNKEQTLSMFLSQAMNKDSSCQKVVNEYALNTDNLCSISTGAYCKSRKKLDKNMIENMCKDLALSNEKKVKNKWKFKNRNVYLVDGTTFIMPDTNSNQKEYPQSRIQKEGLGFPICRMVGIISLSTACLINATVSPFRGKGASEQSMLRSMLGTFKKGDILLADALYSTYYLFDWAIKNEIDIVFVQNGMRSTKCNFKEGSYLGNEDHIITIKRPKKKPDWMDETAFKNSTKELKMRELKVGGKILVTTMLCPKNTTSKEIKKLYKSRWNIEVDFRNIKSTLGLTSFTCKTPEMIIKEMWIYFLAYNLIRSIMIDSAIYNNIYPRQISFKHTLQLVESYRYKKYQILYSKLLILVSKNTIGDREGRIEPRALKKRRNEFPLLMKPRKIAKEEVRRNGHPKP